ncbi:Sun domain-containing 1 [Gossypium australe]|uniref:Sun domain-containing 1 n=1 Tax=Gossypium australe TaxID=47621 RepID=A0A5B6UXC3_9ROSI|nr:Sun domain-containing 1 [Gossypium australe]
MSGIRSRVIPCLGHGLDTELRSRIRPYLGYGINNLYEIPYKTISGIWHRHLEVHMSISQEMFTICDMYCQDNAGIIGHRSSKSHYRLLFGIAKLDLF